MARYTAATTPIALLCALAMTTCGSGDSTSATPQPTAPAAATATPRVGVIVTGVVTEVAASARVVTIAQAKNIPAYVALLDNVKVTRANGQLAQVQDIKPGVEIEAFGQPSSTGPTVLAEEIVIK